MEEKIESINEARNEYINKSIIKPLKAAKILMIVGWSLLIFYVGFYVICVGCFIVGIQLIRKQRIAHGICISLLGPFSLGIWPFVVAIKEIKKKEQVLFDVTSEEFKRSILKGYNVSRILLIIGMPVVCIGLLSWIFGGSFVSFYICSTITYVGVAFTSTQDYRRDKVAHGVCLDLFGTLSLGIWPLIYVMKQRKELTLNIENVEYEIENLDDSINAENLYLIDNNIKKSNDKLSGSLLIAFIMILIAIILMFITIVVVFFIKESTVTYTIYEPIEVSEPYNVEATPDQIKSIPKTYDFYFYTMRLDEIIVCGEDVPIGEYALEVSSDGTTFDAYIQKIGDEQYDGKEVVDGQSFTCSEGMQLRYGRDSGSISLVSKTETKEVVIPGEMAYSVDTEMITTFSEDGSIYEQECWEDDEIVECSSLPTYDTLLDETLEIQESEENQRDVTETMYQGVFRSSCTTTEEEEPISCSDTIMYNELIDNLQ